jgi:hypothetical protein
MSAFSSEPPFGVASSHRGLGISFQVRSLGTSGWGPKDISAARWEYVVRAWLPADPTDLVFDDELDKASNAEDGWVDHYLALGADTTEALTWEIVEVDTEAPDPDTPTAKRERVLIRWTQAVVAGGT